MGKHSKYKKTRKLAAKIPKEEVQIAPPPVQRRERMRVIPPPVPTVGCVNPYQF